MSLTLARGPLSREPAAANFTIDGPPHRILFEPLGRRVRAHLGDAVVLDSRGAFLLHETGLLPQLYVPLEDVRADLEASDTASHCPFKGDASYRTVRAGDRRAVDALWVYDEPIPTAAWLRGFAGVYQDRLEGWLDEDDAVLGRIRDPYHRVDVLTSSRAVRVTAGGTLVAETTRPLLVAETGLEPVLYVPRDDVRVELRPSEQRTVCPYKGVASYWSLDGVEDAAWSYDEPIDGVSRLAGHVAFDGKLVEVRTEG